MQLQSGTLLERGKYRIISTLGRGGFGITYLADQVNLHRKVCIKEFFPKDCYKRDEDSVSISLLSESFKENMSRFKTKFIKEAQTIATLNHANIIPIYDVFEENGTAYYVMDYVDGKSLSARVKSVGALSERDAVGYIKQVAAALEYIHEQQIMHLDVKPGNIMVRTKGDHAILIDFGLSKHYDSESGEATSTTPVGVSHGFAPMEQYQDGGVSTFSPETDIYSLGATLYYLVTGNVPPQATVVAEQGLPQLGALSSNIREAIERSMSYLRKDRPHSIKEFLALLDNVEPVVEVLVADDERTKITAVTDDEKTMIVAPQPKVEQPKVQIDREPKLKQKTERPKRRWWQWLLGLLLIGGGAWFIFGDNKGDDKYADMIAQGLGRDGVYEVGDYYNRNGKEGVVFKVSNGGRHGKIVSLDEAELRWHTDEQHCKGIKLGLTNKSDGEVNTNKVMQRDDSDQYPAFVWCRNKGDGWYLPAKEEVEAIYNNKSVINSTLAKYDAQLTNGWHLSSTEIEGNAKTYEDNPKYNAWIVSIDHGSTLEYYKDHDGYVRAVSTF